jgi:serine/threonine protein kinase/Tol biopolymer transport system component
VITGTKLGPYEIVSPLGEGGMGEVYRAKDTRLGREVALKVLPAAVSRDADRLRRFELEARSTSELNHPNILTVFDVGVHDGTSFIVSELLEGETLREALDGAPLSVRKAVDYAQQIARGLAAAHERGIVHRDLKPENIFITADGRAKILDFGLAKLTQSEESGAQTQIPTRRVNTDPGAVMGTVGYMAPEQVRGRKVDHRADIFSFGAVLYEMLSGRRAFRGESAVDTLSAILKEDPPDLSESNRTISPALERLMLHCLEKDPAARFHSASDLAFALEALSGSTASAQDATTALSLSTPRAKWRARLPWLVAGLAALVAALALASAFLRRAPEPEVRAVRFTIQVPENVSQIGPPVVSPDGRRLVFRLNSPGGKDMLWVRPLDSTDAQPLAGTEDGAQPFWSPDSRAVAFFTPSSGLKKVELSGGPAQTLTEAQVNFGGSWSRDGVIIFSKRGGTGGLYRVPATGGEAVAVTTPDAARKEISHAWPYFLPDGRHFLFLARSTQQENDAICVGSLDSKETKRLLSADSSMAYAPPGYLLYVRENTLMAQPFDAERLELTGEPFPVAREVAANQSNARGMFSVSPGGVLAFRSGSVISNQLSWFDRSGKRLEIISSQPARGFTPRLSPDEKRVAIDRTDPQTPGNSDIWLLDLARGSSTRFTFEAGDEGTPVWSPDGASVVFYSERNGSTAIYRKPASGAGEGEALVTSAERKFVNDWSPDGRFILYQQLSPQTNWDLWLLPLDGERKPTPFVQTNFVEAQGNFSPDGKWIAYTSSESGQWQVYVRSFPDAGGKWMASTEGGAQPQWRSDGRELYYVAPDRKLMAVEVGGDSAAFAAGVPKPLFEIRNVGGFPAGGGYDAARDGKRFLVNSPTQEESPRPITVVLNWTADLKR